jgi:hypothetical protein
MRRLWEEELLGEILSRDAGPLPNSATGRRLPSPGANVSPQPDANATAVANNSVRGQTIARILELHY